MGPIKLIIIKRTVLAMLLGLGFGFLLSEVSFHFIKETNRPPQTVTLEIPAGTADAIARGVAAPSIPGEMTFVVGDVLVVNNQDSENHQLGPMWIPAGGTASLALEEKQNLIFTCSFNPTNIFGLDVKQPVTAGTRILGTVFSGLPLGGILALYSLVIWPIKKDGEIDNPDAVEAHI